MSWLASITREAFRWYLRKFPLRNGKKHLFKLLHQRLAPREGAVVARIAPGFSMKLNLEDPVQRKIYFYGTYDERYEARMVQRLLGAGEIFWDIGANIGFFSLLAAATLRDTGQVVAFEPGGVAYPRLMENIGLNHYKNIITYQAAVTDKPGEAMLHLPAGVTIGCATLFGVRRDPMEAEPCRTVPLDDFSREEGLKPPDFIKIDVEGAELLVLEGAAQTLAQSQPLLLIEMKEVALKAAGTSQGQIQRFLHGLGYQAAFPQWRRWYVASDVRRAPGRNFLWFNADKPAHRHKTALLPILTSPRYSA